MNNNINTELKEIHKGSYEDQIDITDILRIIWKWKYFIFCGTLLCALVAAIISLTVKKIYRVGMVIRPGIINIIEDGDNIYIDSAQNISAVVEAGTFNNQILKSIKNPNSDGLPMAFNFQASIPDNSNTIKISYDTDNIEQGLNLLDNLGKALLERYSEYVEYYKRDYDIKIQLKYSQMTKITNNISTVKSDISTAQSGNENEIKKISNEISAIKAKRDSKKDQIKNIKQRISDIRLDINSIKKNTDLLFEERNKFLATKKNDDNILSSIIYTNTIQQNIGYSDSLKGTISDLNYKIYQEIAAIENLENKIRNLEVKKDNLKKQTKSKIENMKSQAKNLEAEKKYLLEKVKNLEYKKDSIQNIQILQTPTGDPFPIKPNKRRIVMLSGAAGFILILFLVFLWEFISKNKNKILKNNNYSEMEHKGSQVAEQKLIVREDKDYYNRDRIRTF